MAALGERYRVEPGETFTLTGFLRAKSGDALLQIGYNRDGEFLGSTESPHVSGPE